MLDLTLSLSQPWLSSLEEDFRPGFVQIIREGEFLKFRAQLNQASVGTRATGHQQRLWEQGDVVEFFVQQMGDEDYREYQIAPNGSLLSLHYPDRDAVNAVRSGSRQLEEYLAPLPDKAEASLILNGWSAELVIPFTAAKGLRFHCGRYDCSSGKPVLSSTANLSKRDFHRLEEWSVHV